MEAKIFFISGAKCFEIIDSGEGWFNIVERGIRFSCNINIDEESLRRVCTTLRQVTKREGNYYRR